MNIVPLTRQTLKAAAKTVAAAFYDYPSLIAYFPDEKRRAWKLPWYMERVLKSALAYGAVYATEDLSGVLFLLPPGHTRLTEWEYVSCGFLAAPLMVGLRHYEIVDASETYLADTQERLLAGRAHYYLWGLAVDPSRQRSGAGTALLKALFDKTDREGVPVYLETHEFANVAYYEARGFRLIHTGQMPHDALPFWCMLRESGGKIDSPQ